MKFSLNDILLLAEQYNNDSDIIPIPTTLYNIYLNFLLIKKYGLN